MRKISKTNVVCVLMTSLFGLCSTANAQTPQNSNGSPRTMEKDERPVRGAGAGVAGMAKDKIDAMLKMLPIVKALDTDGDGVLSEAEINNAPTALKSLDQNKDKQLTMEEIRPSFDMGAAMSGAANLATNLQSNLGAQGGKLLERLKQFDKNNDGKLSKDEVPPFIAGAFDRADTNKDGFLEKSEMLELGSSLGGGAIGGRLGNLFGGDGGAQGSAGQNPKRPPSSGK